MSPAIHPLYGRASAEITEALDGGVIDVAGLVGALGDLARGQQTELPAEAPVADAIRRVAWLLFVRAPSLDGRYVAMAPMQLALLGAGQRTVGELVDELATLEDGGDEGSLDVILTTHGEALARLVSASFSGASAADGRIAAMTAAMDDRARAAAEAGEWERVPLAGPDAARARGELARMDRTAALAVLDSWRLAEAAADKEDHEAALGAMATAIDAAPKLFENYVRRARYRFGSADRIGAGADLERALQLCPEASAASAMRAELKAVARDIPGSLADWDDAVRHAPEQTAFRIGRGYTRLALGRLDDAVEDFGEAVALAPEDTTPLYNRADALMRMGRIPEAVADYDKVMELAPGDLQARLNRGTAYLMLRRFDEAIADFDVALEGRPGEPTAWAKRAAAHASAGHHWATWLDAMTALSLAEPDWTHTTQLEGMVHAAYQKLGLDPDAVADPADVVARMEVLSRAGAAPALRLADLLDEHLPGEHLDYHLLRGRTYLEHARWPRAGAAFRAAVAVDPSSVAAHLGLGRAVMHEGRAAEALRSLDRAHEQVGELGVEDTFELHAARGRALGTLQRLDEAIAAFREAATTRTDRGDVWFYLGVHLDLAGDQIGALAAYDAAVRLDPGFAPGWFNRACEQAVLGHREAALADLEKAAGIEPKWAQEARRDAYFEPLWSDPEFVALTARFA